MFPSGRWFIGNVHDRGPEKILQGHEENAVQKSNQSHSPSKCQFRQQLSACFVY